MPMPWLWYPTGAGGMWLNYLIWCSLNQRTIPGWPSHFEFPTLQSQCPEYYPCVSFALHVDPPSKGQIRLGSHRAWYNFYLNINIKKSIGDSHGLYAATTSILEYYDQQIDFNLEWTLIWTNEEEFLGRLSELSSYKLTHTEHTKLAFEQYRRSCYLPDITDPEFQQSELFKYWYQAMYDHRTSNLQSPEDRANQVLDLTNKLYWPGNKLHPLR